RWAGPLRSRLTTSSVESEDFLERRRTAVRDALLEQLRHRVLPPCRDVLLLEIPRCRLEIVGLEVPEHLVPAAEDRVVPDTGAAEGVQHLGPDGSVRVDVLVDPLGTHAE